MNDKTGKAPRRWLSPSAALRRFNPPSGMTVGTVAAVERQRVRYGFRIGDIGLLIGQDTSSELLERVPIYPLPKAPAWLLGLINLRGNLVPVFDMWPLLELEHGGDAQDQRRLLILGRSNDAVGLMISSLPQLAATRHVITRLPPLPSVLRPYVAKAYLQDEAVWLEFDYAGFFGALGGQAVEKIG